MNATKKHLTAQLGWTRWLFERADETAEKDYARPEAELLRRRAEAALAVEVLDGALNSLRARAKTQIPKDWPRDRIAAAKRMALEEDNRLAREEIRAEKRLAKLIATFHSLAAPREFSCLGDMSVETAADAAKVAAHASQSLGTRAAASFICHVADRSKPFDRAHAMANWDADQRAAFLAWEAAPWWVK